MRYIDEVTRGSVRLWVAWLGLGGVLVGLSVATILDWPPWFWVAFGLAGPLVAGYQAWARADRELAAVSSRPVLPEHAARLRKVVQGVGQSVKAGHRCNYSDQLHSTIWRDSLRSHEPTLGAVLEQWDDSVSSLDTAKASFDQRLQEELHEREMDKPPYRPDALVRKINEIIVTKARNSPPVRPGRPLVWSSSRDGNPDAEPGWEAWYLSHGSHLIITTPETPFYADTIASAKADVQRLFDDIYIWPELAAIPAAKQTLAELRAPVQQRLATVLGRPTFFGRCDLCREGSML